MPVHCIRVVDSSIQLPTPAFDGRFPCSVEPGVVSHLRSTYPELNFSPDNSIYWLYVDYADDQRRTQLATSVAPGISRDERFLEFAMSELREASVWQDVSD